MKHFVLVSLMSGLAIGHIYADDVVVDANAKEKKAVARTARTNGAVLTLLMTAGAASIGHMINGAKGAFASGGIVILASALSALQKVLKNGAVSAAQDSLDSVYNKFFGEGQVFASMGISLMALLTALIYESGRCDGYSEGYSYGRESTIAFCIKYVENYFPTEILEKSAKELAELKAFA
jgi:hypothetical protein